MGRVLIACERSQFVTIGMRKIGLEAFSCDLLPQEGGRPEWHILGDVRNVLQDGWDMVIAFPPCTHLASSGARWFEEKRKDGRQEDAINFFMIFTRIKSRYVAIENPVGIMSNVWRKPDQIIQPWQFGDSYQKKTCLWIKNLPPLEPTKIVSKGEFVIHGGKRFPKWYSNRTRNRDLTFPGIAAAMVNQWGKLLV